MYKGNIMSVLAGNRDMAKTIAEKLGKLHEDGKIRIFYRRNGDYIRSILSSTEYPEKILDIAEIATLSSKIFIHVGDSLSWIDGELALLSTASGLPTFIVTNRGETEIRKIFKGTSLETSPIVQEPVDEESVMEDNGVVYIDKAFVVKGVGVVVTGFSMTELKVHDKLVLLPSMKETEIKSIQVLDEDQEGVGPGVRVGLALRNVKEEEVKDSYLMVKPGVKAQKEFTGKAIMFPWTQVSEGQFHFVTYGVSVTGSLQKNGEEYKVTLNQPIPKPKRIVILNVNTKQGKPRVAGYFLP
ncbi:translation elongation factor [Metallosphaera javensis (ex Sakai et al. 2022)]|uniref:translation elongation factor n=1 Tax=Metallosphaera javensis (ex Sakai et al. 2022) TaxID=2775498 RepID=UPI00258A66C1|nr:MAG: translation elongation factor [Metallosphaera javensis (ex Sakai et al. 2022)]